MKFGTTALLLALAVPVNGLVNLASVYATTKSSSSNLDSQRALDRENFMKDSLSKLALASLFSVSLLTSPLPALADGQTEKFKLPPIDFNDKSRCSLNSSTIGQANAARDKLYDLRQCKLSGANAAGFDLSGVIMTDTDVSKANFQEAYFSKGYLQGEVAIVAHVVVCFRVSHSNANPTSHFLFGVQSQHQSLMEPTLPMLLLIVLASRVALLEVPFSRMQS